MNIVCSYLVEAFFFFSKCRNYCASACLLHEFRSLKIISTYEQAHYSKTNFPLPLIKSLHSLSKAPAPSPIRNSIEPFQLGSVITHPPIIMCWPTDRGSWPTGQFLRPIHQEQKFLTHPPRTFQVRTETPFTPLSIIFVTNHICHRRYVNNRSILGINFVILKEITITINKRILAYTSQKPKAPPKSPT